MQPALGWPRFGSVRLRFGDGTARAVPVFGSGGSSKEGFLCAERTVPVPVSVPGKRFRRFRFRVRFLAKRLNGSDGSGFRFQFGSWATLHAAPKAPHKKGVHTALLTAQACEHLLAAQECKHLLTAQERELVLQDVSFLERSKRHLPEGRF